MLKCRLKLKDNLFFPGKVEDFVFIIGIFHGMTKPDRDQFCSPMIEELKELLQNGFSFNGRRVYIQIRCFCMDAPARAHFKHTKLCSGYSGCDYCTLAGDWDGRIVYLATDFSKRTDSSFRSMNDPDHHIGISPLLEIPSLDMVHSFPIDYMHQICLGVVKKLISAYIYGHFSCRQSSRTIESISDELVFLEQFTPKIFSRRPRRLCFLNQFKATEFRLFLLYSGIYALRDKLPRHLYEHFLLLSCAVRILCHPQLVLSHSALARAASYFQTFVEKSKVYCGNSFLVFNVHSLLHVTNFAQLYGSLDNFSCFPFENAMYKIKRMIRSGHRPLEQVVNRIKERDQIITQTGEVAPCVPTVPHHDGPLPPECQFVAQFRKCSVFSTFENGRGFQFQSKVFIIFNIVTDDSSSVCFICKQFLLLDEYFTYPCLSSSFGIYKVSKLSRDFVSLSFAYDMMPCFLIPKSDFFVCIPVLDYRREQ